MGEPSKTHHPERHADRSRETRAASALTLHHCSLVLAPTPGGPIAAAQAYSIGEAYKEEDRLAACSATSHLDDRAKTFPFGSSSS